MPDLPTLALFTAAALVMNLSPGPSNLYVLARSVGDGRRAGVLAALGLALGALVHVAATAFGLAALLALAPGAYAAIKLAGAAYLVWLGARLLLASTRPGAPAAAPPARARRTHRVLAEGALVEIANPKTALFFLAFLPQFVDPTRGPATPQLLLLGAIVVATALPCDLLVAHGGGRAADWLRRHPRLRGWQQRAAGGVLVGLGLHLALDERGP